MNKHITVLLIIHLFFHLNVCATWNKCCDPFSNLIKISTNNSQIYQCTNHTENNVHLITKTPARSFGIPENCCDNLTCIDKLIDPSKSNGEIIALNCENMRNSNTPQLPTISKCCPEGLYYNKKLKICENETTSIVAKLHDSIADAFNINYSFPICNRRVYMEKEYNNVSINITNGVLHLTLEENKFTETFPYGEYCIDTREKNHILSAIVVYCIPLKLNVKKVCTENTCVPKCCPFGHIYKKGKVKSFECYPEWGVPFNPPFTNKTTEVVPDSFHILNAPNCPSGKYLARDFVLFKNGTIHTSKILFYDSYVNKYCIEMFDTPSMQKKYTVVICFSPNTKEFSSIFLHLVGLLISILFLGVTLTIYFFLPELQNLHGRTVMSHTASLLAAYICLAFVKQQSTQFGKNTCMILGYGIMFTFLSAFTWLNVMCFDIWWTFGVVHARGITKNKHLKKFIYYCIYAHGIPLIITAIAIIVDLHPNVPALYKPKIAEYSCWFNLNRGVPIEYTIFFVTPVATLILCNMTLFVLTARHCIKIRRDIQRMQHNDLVKKKRFLADRATFLMNVKLFIVMGITWVFELISVYVTKPAELWIFFDTINVLQGLWIFFIFVFKNNVWKAIKKKLGYETTRDGSTQATLSTKMSIASNTSIKLNNLKQEEKDLLQNVVNKDRIEETSN